MRRDPTEPGFNPSLDSVVCIIVTPWQRRSVSSDVQPVARQFRLHAPIPIRDKLSLRVGRHLSNLGSCDRTPRAVAAFYCAQKVW